MSCSALSILKLIPAILSALGSSQLAIRQEGEQQVPGMPGAGDIARCTATGDCPVSLSTSSCLGKIDPQCAEELCGVSPPYFRLRLASASLRCLPHTPISHRLTSLLPRTQGSQPRDRVFNQHSCPPLIAELTPDGGFGAVRRLRDQHGQFRFLVRRRDPDALS